MGRLEWQQRRKIDGHNLLRDLLVFAAFAC